MSRRRRSRIKHGPPVEVGRYTDPSTCEHPPSARVTSALAGQVARCHDCGCVLTRRGWTLESAW